MPCLHESAFHRRQVKVKSKISLSNEHWRHELAAVVKKAHIDSGIIEDKGYINVMVSYDGTWHKRGHTSHTGVGMIIDVFTGLVLDYEVLSNFCQHCAARRFKMNEASFVEWQQLHEANGDCEKNFNGTAGMMEVMAAEILWRRSMSLGFRYITMVSDGDSKSYNHICSLDLYGTEYKIEKEECLNHVAKRLGTGLRRAVAEAKARGQTFGGKGKLTQKRITKWQSYYRNAIKAGGTIEDIQKRINAILLHSMSTEEASCHRFCPSSEASWCYHNRALARGEEPKVPITHEALPRDIGKSLIPLFHRLSSPELLKRCQGDKTQNANESFNALIWKFCPKATFVGRSTVNLAATMAVKAFNEGPLGSLKLLTAAGLQVGENSLSLSELMDKRALKRAKIASTSYSKHTRKLRNMAKSKIRRRFGSKRGKSYGMGEF